MQGHVHDSVADTVSREPPILLTTDILLIYCQSTSHSIRKQTNKNIQLLSH